VCTAYHWLCTRITPGKAIKTPVFLLKATVIALDSSKDALMKFGSVLGGHVKLHGLIIFLIS
jgi:hypothetical protein